MADKNAEVAVEDNGGMKKTLSLWNFFTIGFGAIIGTGWVLQVGDWMVVGGGPVPAMIAFLLGAIFLVPVGAVFGELTAAIPISGGIVEYVDRSFGRTLSYITGWLLALGNGILCPWEAIAISTLVSEMFGSLPGLEWLRAVKLYTILGADVYLFPTLIALGFAVYVIFLNFRGASSAAKLQAFLTKALLCDMLLAMGVSLFTGSPDNAMPVFSQVAGAGGGKAATESTSLFAGIVSVLVLTPFFYAGFDTIPQQAEEAAEGLNWNKFGKIISLTLLAAGGFYMVCIYSFGTILDWHEFVKSPVPALACLKGINMLLYLAMLVIATLGPMGPMNSFYGATSRIMLAMGRRGRPQVRRSQARLRCSGRHHRRRSVPGQEHAHPSDQRVGSRLHLLLRHGRPRLPAYALHRARPASSLRGARWQVWHLPRYRCLRHHHRPARDSVLSRLPQHGGVEHRDRLVGYWPGPHGLYQFPQKVTPSRGGSGARDPLFRTEPGTTWVAL